MNKKEVNEIKGLFNPEDCPITRICGCFVDVDKEKKAKLKDAFFALDEESRFKYFDIFKKNMSGNLGKNLINLEFPTEQETAEDGTQRYMMTLLKSELDDEDLLDDFYDKVIENLEYADNYYIILIHGAYDIPAITTDKLALDDASDCIYNFIMCAICPVKPSKPGLRYNAATNAIENSIRDMMVDPPMQGFLFPAYNDRNTDVHNLLYYTKNAKEIDSAITEELLGVVTPFTAATQKDVFNEMITDSLGRDCGFEKIKSLHANLMEAIEEKKDDPEPLVLDKSEVKHLLSRSGASMDQVETLGLEYDEQISKETPILASNIADKRKFEVKLPDVTINVHPDRTDLITTKMINGVPHIVIEMTDAVSVNGIRCLPLAGLEDEM